ncbi:MAG: hypothetical protein KAS93_07970, partial [Gammaproteobacteria bacterium]|nr:hypothetical protein [Gammaproteobacteria bacterium]
DGTKRNHENGVLVKLNVQAAAIGWIVEIHPRTKDLIDDINNARNFISNCWFDEEKCDSILTASEQRTGGLLALENFRKEWNEHLGCWKRTPLHDWASHSAAAFRTLAGTFQIAQHSYVNQQRRIVVKRKPTGWT